MSPSQAPGSLNWYLITDQHSHCLNLCQDMMSDPCDGFVDPEEGDFSPGCPLPPSLQGAVAGTSGRVGTLDLTFQFDNPLTGQARGQTSLVGNRYPQKFPPFFHQLFKKISHQHFKHRKNCETALDNV